MNMPRKFGPMPSDSPEIGDKCAACDKPFKAGDYTTLSIIGPGDDAEAQARAREGRAYNAVAVHVHWACVTGETQNG